MTRRIVIVGHGMVGARFVEESRRHDPAGERVALTVFGAESHPAARYRGTGRSGALICRCNTVSKGALVTAWRAGATDAEALSKVTRAGTGCGSCRSAVSGICDWLTAAEPAERGEGAA